MQFDPQDLAALHALDAGFEISADGAVATVEGPMRVVATRPDQMDGSHIWLLFTFPAGEEFLVECSRSPMLHELGIEQPS
jgi:hypothetical protein